MVPQRKQGVCLTTSPVVLVGGFGDSNPSTAQYSSFRSSSEFVGSGGEIVINGAPLSSLPRCQSTRDRQLCELITFKGHHTRNSNLNNMNMNKNNQQFDKLNLKPHEGGAGVTMATQQQEIGDAIASKHANIFQIVPLDDEPRFRPAVMIEPVSLYPARRSDGGEGKGANPGQGAKLPRPPFKFAGLLGTVASAFLFSIAILCVKLMPLENVIQEKLKIVMIRGISLMTLCAITILIQGSTFLIRRDEILVNCVRSFVGFFGALGVYVAVQYITVAETTALTYTSPLWTCLLGYLLLGERLPITMLAGLPLGALGLILIAHPDLILNVQDEVITEVHRHHHHIVPPPNYTMLHHHHHHNHLMVNYTMATTLNTTTTMNVTDVELLDLELLDPEDTTELYLEQRWPGVLAAIGTSVIIAIVHIALKFRKTTPIQTTTFYLGLATLILSTLIQSFIGFGKWPATMLEWCLHLVIGLCSYTGQALFQWSLLYETAGTLSVVRSVDIVFSFIWSAVFLNEDVLMTSVAGAVLIGLVIILIMFNDYFQSKLTAAAAACCKRNHKSSV